MENRISEDEEECVLTVKDREVNKFDGQSEPILSYQK